MVKFISSTTINLYSKKQIYSNMCSPHKLVEKYLKQKTGVRHNTAANYKFVLNIIKKDPFGKRRIDRVRLSDAKEWLIRLQQEGRGYSSIHSIRGVVRPAFQMAVDDDLIRNPHSTHRQERALRQIKHFGT